MQVILLAGNKSTRVLVIVLHVVAPHTYSRSSDRHFAGFSRACALSILTVCVPAIACTCPMLTGARVDCDRRSSSAATRAATSSSACIWTSRARTSCARPHRVAVAPSTARRTVLPLSVCFPPKIRLILILPSPSAWLVCVPFIVGVARDTSGSAPQGVRARCYAL